MSHSSPIVLLSLLLLWGSAPLEAQSEPGVTPVWITLGIGAGDMGPMGPAVQAEIVAQRNRHRFALRASKVAGIMADAVGDVGLLYGLASDGPRSHASISAGVGRVTFSRCPGFPVGGPCEDTTAVGFPASATLSFRPFDMFGFGIQGFVNVNSLANFGGATAILEFGRLR